MPKKGERAHGRHAAGVPRPHMWVYKDPLQHEMHLPFLRAKAQAEFRNEGWRLSFDEFYEVWRNDWYNRGRKGDNVCLTRKIDSKPWTKGNVELITRLEHLRRQGLQRRTLGMKYNRRTGNDQNN